MRPTPTYIYTWQWPARKLIDYFGHCTRLNSMFALIGYSMLRIFLESFKGGETRGAFHSMKTSGLNFRRLTEKTTTLHGARYTKNFREFWLKGKRPRANISFSQWKTQLVSGAFSFTWKRGPWERGLIQRLVNMYIMQRWWFMIGQLKSKVIKSIKKQVLLLKIFILCPLWKL